MEIEEKTQSIRIKMKELREKTKALTSENPFDFTAYNERQKEEDEIDLEVFFRITIRR